MGIIFGFLTGAVLYGFLGSLLTHASKEVWWSLEVLVAAFVGACIGALGGVFDILAGTAEKNRVGKGALGAIFGGLVGCGIVAKLDMSGLAEFFTIFFIVICGAFLGIVLSKSNNEE